MIGWGNRISLMIGWGNRIDEWSQRWQLPFNETKCKCMHFGSRYPKFTYSPNNHFLDEEKDLGVIVAGSLKFHRHGQESKFCVRCN